MDIKAISLMSYPVVSTQKCRQPLAYSPECVHALPPLMSDEIIDYAEVQINNYQPARGRQTPYQIQMDRNIIGKGTLIDIWI
jgi:hypothetical protein